MTDNKVKHNDDNTEIMIISPSGVSTSLSTQDYYATCNTPVPLYDTFNHVSVTLDCHVVNHVRTANFERRRISFIRHLITTEATATLVSAITLSRLDYCTVTLSFLAAHCP